ncbi:MULTISPECIES: bifunctional 2-polyprenyl-6-hydroxyphenol methylase/3-demethylubiquinol 3-O-methyltransferase UbiG [unclassified Methanoregula]|uniref:class I SAM-dependent methyltransferase n=1 Tax=unclassified Methanoregula TaxID=2649730 RepID=UPI0009D5B6DD|nr:MULTISPECIES: class I SAM-dependent methyltransferase [unclassified Methanoregula]OPX63617.1 MAG: bifunctional 3-demethylubiquinone-9 3-methyltransferase/ 2-octaprenyl-6-hydroxy phenol methylase [Methanoregula sp. PtaB.Bin085]OPY36217.1 MAG: bifunctional 3-demethylubiquinone-9 3-methyltransferase/ 2-octaprenyl-6-hydroxy phenol methylase [Methanoregula sp. PtaU1.Bin006]
MKNAFSFTRKKIQSLKHWGYSVKYITSLADLDRELDYVDSQFQISDDCGRLALSNFCFKIRRDDLPRNPFSREYYDFQMRLYSFISGRAGYDIANEEHVFDGEEMKNYPYPYSTGSASTVADHLLSIGYVIKKANLPAYSTVLEFGSGWGNLTLTLAQMKYNVTCVEINKRFIDLIKYRSRDLKNQIRFFQQDMLSFSQDPDKKYDAVFFHESFDHCCDPITMIKNLSNLLSENGIICFASEPVMSYPIKFLPNPVLPYPWGVRLDGISVWSMRRFGWMELGFERHFFIQMLSDAGFRSDLFSSDASPHMNLIIARKK